MYEKVVTKTKDILWLHTGDSYGRKEIARWQFANWELRQEGKRNDCSSR